MSSLNPQISIVVPLYNEEAGFSLLIERLNNLINQSALKIEIVLIDDGSKDDTSLLMRQLALFDEHYQAIFLSRNYGHQTALTAGIANAKATEALMIIDGDLQDPPELLTEFYNYFKEGYDVVYAIRTKRKENWIKRLCYSLFYRILGSISYIQIPIDSGDFSLISRKVADVIIAMPEESRFIRGMRTWVGFNQIGISYERQARLNGDSKYSLKMLFKLAYNGIFNFSEFPIKFITRIGFITILSALIYFVITIIKKWFYGTVPQGFTALLFMIILFSGVQLISIGIIGEYILRIFFQVKGRPLYIIKNKISDKKLIDSGI